MNGTKLNRQKFRYDLCVIQNLGIIKEGLSMMVLLSWAVFVLPVYEIDDRTDQYTCAHIYSHQGQNEMAPGRKYGLGGTGYRTGKHDIGVTSCIKKMAMELTTFCQVRSWDKTHSERGIVWLVMISLIYAIVISIVRNVIRKSK